MTRESGRTEKGVARVSAPVTESSREIFTADSWRGTFDGAEPSGFEGVGEVSIRLKELAPVWRMVLLQPKGEQSPESDAKTLIWSFQNRQAQMGSEFERLSTFGCTDLG
jgi:hypothetical protein